MSAKRKNDARDSTLSSKRSRSSLTQDIIDVEDSNPGYQIRSHVDPVYGQRGAFPGLEAAEGENDLVYGPADDGLSYLRMVRLERQDVPTILSVPATQRRSPPDLDIEGGYYEDGAYVGAPEGLIPEISSSASDDGSEIDPQEAYYPTLIARFDIFRQTLRTTTHGPSSTELLLNYATAHNVAPHRWENAFCAHAPTPLHVAALSQEEVIRGIDRICELTSKKVLLDAVAGRNVGIWIWALLAKCRELGEMSSEEVGTLRELGKRALSLGRKLRSSRPQVEVEGENQDTEIAEQADVVTPGEKVMDRADDDSEKLERMRQQVLDTIRVGEVGKSSEAAKVERSIETWRRALATLDIIVTIIGEMYGQRDLLDGRAAWSIE